jgi:multiple sugar transport system permease protein
MKKPIIVLKYFSIYTVLTVAVIVSILPVLWVVSLSFKPPLDTMAIPPKLIFTPTLESYRMLFTAEGTTNAVNLQLFLKNSFVVSFISTLITMVIALFGAYSLSRFRFKGKNGVGLLILATRMLPPLASSIPLFLIFQNSGLYDTHLGLIIAYTAINIPFAIWMVRGYIDDVPVEIEEAAHMDGCSRFATLWRIIIPVTTPGIAAAAAYTFILAWNDFALALMLTSRNVKTMPLMVLSFLTAEGVEYGPMTAAATIALVPPIIFVIFAQKYLARGLTMGAVKG